MKKNEILLFIKMKFFDGIHYHTSADHLRCAYLGFIAKVVCVTSPIYNSIV